MWSFYSSILNKTDANISDNNLLNNIPEKTLLNISKKELLNISQNNLLNNLTDNIKNLFIKLNKDNKDKKENNIVVPESINKIQNIQDYSDEISESESFIPEINITIESQSELEKNKEELYLIKRIFFTYLDYDIYIF